MITGGEFQLHSHELQLEQEIMRADREIARADREAKRAMEAEAQHARLLEELDAAKRAITQSDRMKS